jgi:hypothetical protein
LLQPLPRLHIPDSNLLKYVLFYYILYVWLSYIW